MKVMGTKGGIEMKWFAEQPFFKFYYYDIQLGPLTITHEINPNYNFHGYPINNIIDSIKNGSKPAITFKQAALHLNYISQVYSASGFYKITEGGR